MGFKEWLATNGIRASHVAKELGISPPGLGRALNGQRWPSERIQVAAYRMSGGEIGLAQWIETCRPFLEKKGILKPGEQISGKSQSKRASKAPRKAEGINEGENAPA